MLLVFMTKGTIYFLLIVPVTVTTTENNSHFLLHFLCLERCLTTTTLTLERFPFDFPEDLGLGAYLARRSSFSRRVFFSSISFMSLDSVSTFFIRESFKSSTSFALEARSLLTSSSRR